MATYTSISAKSNGSVQLPIPKVKLYKGDAVRPVTQTIIGYKYGANSQGTDFKLYNYPVVIAQDLTQEQIDRGVYVEMSYYRGGKSQSSSGYGNETGSSYVVPAPYIGGINPLGNKWTRGGIQNFFGGTPFYGDKPNHYKVNLQNEFINVYEYLHNRFSEFPVAYRDITGANQVLSVIVPSFRIRKFMNRASSYFGYSGVLAPLYIKFRYVMWDDEANQFISGPDSRVVKILPKDFPFNFDEAASASLGVGANYLNANFQMDQMEAMFETHLP